MCRVKELETLQEQVQQNHGKTLVDEETLEEMVLLRERVVQLETQGHQPGEAVHGTAFAVVAFGCRVTPASTMGDTQLQAGLYPVKGMLGASLGAAHLQGGSVFLTAKRSTQSCCLSQSKQCWPS